ncbi:MAG TPA: hypothetical protein DEF34_02550 [Desulfotomaculum sp.]|nr:MAG: hypothetical protein JL56_13470 [Desulfotomaculum sp. BICA1-6]HBX22507.1 hypothetical protein [Desulfotomaculum sp.]
MLRLKHLICPVKVFILTGITRYKKIKFIIVKFPIGLHGVALPNPTGLASDLVLNWAGFLFPRCTILEKN